MSGGPRAPLRGATPPRPSPAPAAQGREKSRRIYQPFSWKIRVYWEDTDAGGVVYHARYAYFLERARSEWLRALGVEQGTLREREDLVFAVRAMQLDFLRPARLDDLLECTAQVTHVGGASLRFGQSILRDGELLVSAEVRAACLTASGFRPRPLPDWLQQETPPQETR